jgi:hypothetical protein
MSEAEFFGMFPGWGWASLLLLALMAVSVVWNFRSAPIGDQAERHANQGLAGLILFAVFLSIPVIWVFDVVEVPYLFGHICQFLVAHHM